MSTHDLSGFKVCHFCWLPTVKRSPQLVRANFEASFVAIGELFPVPMRLTLCRSTFGREINDAQGRGHPEALRFQIEEDG